jgi:uncharacterized membrane protein
MPNTIRNPIEYMVDEVNELAHGVGLAGKSLQRTSAHMFTKPLAIQRITVDDLKDVLKKGYSDLGAFRTDVIFLIGIYPLVIILAAAAAFNAELLPLVFPIISGTAIMGPFVGVLLYEMSRRRELAELRHHEEHYSWTDALSIVKSRNFGAIIMLGLILVALYVVWLGTAYAIYRGLQGPQPLESFGYFVQGLFETQAGWWMIILGCAVGFLFAALALVIGVVSFPLLLDRQDVGLGTAIWTSIRVTFANPGPIAAWGLIVTGGLALGAIPLFIGLVVVMPVLCHATWHLYRKLLPRQAAHKHG